MYITYVYVYVYVYSTYFLNPYIYIYIMVCKLSKVFSIVAMYIKFTRALKFERVCQGGAWEQVDVVQCSECECLTRDGCFGAALAVSGVCIYIYIYLCVYIYVYICICMYVCMYMYIHVCMYVCMYIDIIRMYVYTYIDVYVCVCMCVCIYVCIIHTYVRVSYVSS